VRGIWLFVDIGEFVDYHYLNSHFITRESDYCLTPNKHFFSAISWREQVTSWLYEDDDVLFVPDQDPDWDFYYAISLKQQSAGRRVAPLGHIIPVPSQPVFTLTP
jgi:hypothetical protein